MRIFETDFVISIFVISKVPGVKRQCFIKPVLVIEIHRHRDQRDGRGELLLPLLRVPGGPGARERTHCRLCPGGKILLLLLPVVQKSNNNQERGWVPQWAVWGGEGVLLVWGPFQSGHLSSGYLVAGLFLRVEDLDEGSVRPSLGLAKFPSHSNYSAARYRFFCIAISQQNVDLQLLPVNWEQM